MSNLLHLKIKTQGFVPGRGQKTKFNDALAASYAAGGLYWQQKIMNRHFQSGAAQRYGYTPRKGEEPGISKKRFWASYTGRKLREKGHKRPLVYSGRSEVLMQIPKVVATATGGRVSAKVYRFANAFNFRPKNSQVDMAREISTVLSGEVEEIVAEIDRKLGPELAAIQDKNEIKIG